MTEAKNAEAGLPAKTETVAFGIKNQYGQFWTTDTFNSPEQAAKYWRDFWKQPGFQNGQPHDPIIVVCQLTLVEVIPPKDKSNG